MHLSCEAIEEFESAPLAFDTDPRTVEKNVNPLSVTSCREVSTTTKS
jgi:hypothetical protein